MKNTIELETVVKAPGALVWSALTEGDHLGQWFGNGEPTRIDLRLGGSVVFDHGSHGDIPAVIEELEPLSAVAFRWAVIGAAGTMATPDNSTVIRFRLQEEGGATAVKVSEGDFSKVVAPADEIEARYQANLAGWPQVLGQLTEYVEQMAAHPA